MAETQQNVTVAVKAAGDGPDQIKAMLGTLKELLMVEKEIKGQAQLIAEQRRQAAQQAQQEAAHRKKMQQDEEKSRKERTQGAVQGARNLAAMAQNPMQAMAGGAMGSGGAIIGAIMQAVNSGIGKVATGLEIANQSFSTNAQKRRQWQDEYLPFSESLHRLGDAIDNVAGRVEQANLRFAAAAAVQQVRIQEAAALRPVQAEERMLQARARATANFNMPSAAYIDRSTVGGAIAYGEQQMRLPAQQQLAQAQMEASAARDAAGREAGRETTMRNQLGDAEREFRRRVARAQQLRVNEDVSGVRKEAERTQAQNDVELAAQDVAAKSAALAEQARIAKEAGARAVEAESNARKAGIELQKAELEILKQREQRMASMAQGVGAMGRAGRAQALRALQRFIKRGPENSTEQEMALASRIAPEYVRQQQERFGEQFYRGRVRSTLGDEQFGKLFGPDFARNETLAQLRRSQNQAQVSIAAQINLDTRATAAALAQQMAPLIQALKDAFDTQARIAADRAREEAFRRSNSTQGAARK